MVVKKFVLSICVIVGLTFASTPSWGYSLVGSGWDGPGQNSWSLDYYFDASTGALSVPDQQAALVNPMNAWAAVVDITFTHDQAGGAAKITPSTTNSLELVTSVGN